MATLTQEQFVARAQAMHGGKYSYEKAVYLRMHAKVTITCFVHGDFEQTPDGHIGRGNGCKKCTRVGLTLLSTKEFIRRARKVHGNNYTYKKTVYRGMLYIKVTITCPKHGDFQQTPNSHIHGKNGCPTCGRDATRVTQDEFLRRARKVHGSKYRYPSPTFNSTVKMKIICPKHGQFLQLPGFHLRGVGCAKCKHDRQRFSLAQFILRAKQIHGTKYSYPGPYINGKTKMKILCPTHGIFLQEPSQHIHLGIGCPKCGTDVRFLTQKAFEARAREAHGEKYSYPEPYRGAGYKIKIICPTHGPFSQLTMNHLSGVGCPTCKASRGEVAVAKYLAATGLNFVPQSHCIPHKAKLSFDFHLTDLRILIEFHGEQHYVRVAHFERVGDGRYTLARRQQVDRFKARWARRNGFKLIVIKYTCKDIAAYLKRKGLSAATALAAA